MRYSAVVVFRDITGRKRAEAALRRAHDKLELRVEERTVELRDSRMRLIDAIESISERFILFDSDERLVICNDKYREQFSVVADVLVPGVALEDLLRAAAERGQVAENADGVKAWMRNRLAQYRKGKGTIEQQLGDGRWVLATERRTRDGGIVGIRTDITEIKRAEEALRASEARIADAYRLARITYWERSNDTKTILYRPDAYVETGGAPFAEAPTTYEAFYPFIHPGDRERVRECYERADAEGSDFAIEFRLLHTNGGVRYFREHGKAVFDDAGRFTGHTGTNQDITDLRESEIALRQSEARLINAQRIAKLGDWEFDIATDEMRWSDETCRIFGVPPEDPEPRRDRFRRSVNPGDLALVEAADQRAIEGDGHTSVDFRITLPGGEIRYIHGEGEVTFDDAGKAIRLTGTNQDITDRKRAEDALKESGAKLREILDNSPVGVAVVSHAIDDARATGNRLFINSAFVQMFGGASREDLIEAKIFDSWVDLDRLRAAEKIMKNRGDLVDFEARRRRLDGTEWWVSMNSRPIRFDDQDCTMVWHFDITERKRAEEALRQCEARYREIFEASPVGIGESNWSGVRRMVDDLAKRGVKDLRQYFERNPDKFIEAYDRIELTDASQAILALYGVPDTTVLADMYVSATVPPDNLEGVLEAILSFISGRMESVYEAREHRSDGTEITTRNHLAVPPNHHHDWSRVIYAVEDITERKRTEEALRLSQFAIDHAGDAAFWLDRGGRVVYANDTTRGQLGYSRDELLGLAITDIDSAVGPGDFDRAMERVKAEGSFRLEAQYRTKSGAAIPVEISVYHLKYGDTELMACYARDITDRLRAEEQLRQAQKMEVVGQLTGGIAHDFNNLLAVVMGNLELIEEDLAENEHLHEMLSLAIDATDDAATLTHRLLAFSRIQPLSPRVADTNALVRKSVGLVRRTLDETIGLQTAYAAGLAPVFVDPGQLESALLNLVVNARDAMARGGEISIATGAARFGGTESGHDHDIEPGDYVTVSVRDTGTGIAPDVLEHVFEPFFTTKEIGHGSGLGLSMVFGFVKQSGGHVDIDSEPGQGTTVTIHLSASAEEPAGDAPVSPSTRHHGAGETILVVEDDHRVRELAVAMLTGLGYRVHEAGDGKSALAVIDDSPNVALLFTDVILPGGMDGVELAREARRRRPHLPMLYVSAYSASALMQKGRLDDGAELVEKPFRRQELAAKLAAMLA